MLVWIIIALILAFMTIFEMLLGFTIPFPALRSTVLFLVVLGMTYRIHIMDKGGEKETLKNRIRELEDKIREDTMTA